MVMEIVPIMGFEIGAVKVGNEIGFSKFFRSYFL